MIEMKSLKCTHCAKAFDRIAKDWRYDIKCGAKDFFCSKQCHTNYQLSTNKKIICEECSQEKSIHYCDYKKSQSKLFFCSRSCRAIFYNKRKVHVTDNKIKEARCIDCGILNCVSKHVMLSVVRCKNCKNKYLSPAKVKQKTKIEKCCIDCSVTIFVTPATKYCFSCRKQVISAAGRKSAYYQAENRRSLNEKYFAEALIYKFGKENVICNEPIFVDKKGYLWDADIILPKYKLAIHWNGNWHYKKITKKHSITQVQNRDKIKYSIIENAGYNNYIIKDLGKFNKKKIKEEVEKLLIYLK